MTTAPTPFDRKHVPHRHHSVVLVVFAVLVGAAVVLLVRHDRAVESSTSAVHGSGVAASQARDLAAFAAVDLAGSNNVVVHVGGPQSVVVHADENLIDNVTTAVVGGRLVVANRGSFVANSPMSVEVTTPSLDMVSLSGSGNVTVDGVRAEDFTVDVPGSGVLAVGGRTMRLDAGLSGSGDVQLQGLVAQHATATVSGSGRLRVHATESLNAIISGSGAIFYRGDPGNVSESVTGAGAIIEE